MKKIFGLCLIFSLISSLNFASAQSSADQSTISLTVGIEVGFSGAPRSGPMPLTVNFTDLSNASSAATYAWTFGDGGSSGEKNPTHIYTSEGTYTVSLTVTDGITSNSFTKENYITVNPRGGPGPIEPSPPSPQPPFIFQVQAVPAEYSVVITWQTLEPASTEIDWGRTQDYEAGRVIARPDDLITEHEIILENLTPDTVYHFRIRARNAHGFEVVSRDYLFKTLFVDLIPPANISDFQAIPDDQVIALQWVNPPDDDFAGLKIMRSSEFFPLSPEQGQEIYNSNGTAFIDAGLENGQRYYYTGFAYDQSGNYASGAIVTAVPWPPQEPLPPEWPPIIPPELPLPPLPPEWPAMPPEKPPFPPEFPPLKEITIQDVDFFQQDKVISPDKQGKVKLIADLPAQISISAEKLPQALKSIILHIALASPSTDQSAAAVSGLGQPQSASYLLKINPEKTAYQATIVIPKKSGQYDLTLIILNYQEGTITEVTGQLIVRQPLFLLPFQEVPGLYALFFLIIIILIIFLIAYLWSRRKKKSKQKLSLPSPELKPD